MPLSQIGLKAHVQAADATPNVWGLIENFCCQCRLLSGFFRLFAVAFYGRFFTFSLLEICVIFFGATYAFHLRSKKNLHELKKGNSPEALF